MSLANGSATGRAGPDTALGPAGSTTPVAGNPRGSPTADAANGGPWSYTTLDGEVLDLTLLSDEEHAFFTRCYDAYCAGTMRWDAFADLVSGRQNPLLGSTGGRITREVMTHPLYQAVHDLEGRIGLRTGDLSPAGEDPALVARDPVDDDWIGPTEAAQRKGVTRAAVHHAINRGSLVARSQRPGGAWMCVSVNSLTRWTPQAGRQAAGRVSARVRRENTASLAAS
jgi:hypothetical protein